MSKKPKTPNPFDVALQKLAGQSPAVHLACAAPLALISYALITQDSKLSGLFAGSGALLFALMGLNGSNNN